MDYERELYTIPSSSQAEAIGRFLVACCYLQTHLSIVYRAWTNTSGTNASDDTIRRQIGDPGVTNLCKSLREELAANGVAMESSPVGQAMAKILAEVDNINSVRNDVAHQPFSTHEGTMMFSNHLISKRSNWSALKCTEKQLCDWADFTFTVIRTFREVNDIGATDQKRITSIASELSTLRKKLALPMPEKLNKNQPHRKPQDPHQSSPQSPERQAKPHRQCKAP